MDLPCNCLGVATAARVPVKRYNFLVPSVYRAERDNSLGKPCGPGVDRSIKKLSEYLTRNPHRVPKASRRLARHLNNDLEARRLGKVQVSAEAYLGLVQALGPDNCRLLAPELILGRVAPRRNFLTACLRPCVTNEGVSSDVLHSVIGRLLRDDASGVRALGCQLAVAFIRQQGASAEFDLALQTIVPLLCEAANPRRPFSGREHVAEKDLARLRAAAWAALLEYAAYEQRAAIRSKQRRPIVLTALDALEYELLDEGKRGSGALGAVQHAETLVDELLSSAAPWQRETDTSAALDYMDRQGRWAVVAQKEEEEEEEEGRQVPLAAALSALERSFASSNSGAEPVPSYRLVKLLVERAASSEQPEAVLSIAAHRVEALGPGQARAALGDVGIALSSRSPPLLTALCRLVETLAAKLDRGSRLETTAELLSGQRSGNNLTLVQICVTALATPYLTASTPPHGDGRFQAPTTSPLPRGLLSACGGVVSLRDVPAEYAVRLLVLCLADARDQLSLDEERILTDALFKLATDKGITPTLAGDLCELLRRLGTNTAGNVLKRLRAGMFSQQQTAGPSPSQYGEDDAVPAVPQPIQASVLLLVASVASDTQPDELSQVLKDSLAVQDSGLRVLAQEYSPADDDRAAAFMTLKASEAPLSWTIPPDAGSGPAFMLLDQLPRRGGDTGRKPLENGTPGSDHLPKDEPVVPRPQAERLRLLYHGADLYPDELALAALPSGSFSTSTRLKSMELQRQHSSVVALESHCIVQSMELKIKVPSTNPDISEGLYAGPPYMDFETSSARSMDWQGLDDPRQENLLTPPRGSPTASMESERFPCLALQLEEQARELEDAWACCDEPDVPSLSIPLDSLVRTSKPGYQDELPAGLSGCGHASSCQQAEAVSASGPVVDDWAAEDSCCTALSPQRPRTPRDRREVPSPARLLLTSADTSSSLTLPTPRQEARPLSATTASSPTIGESRPESSAARSSALGATDAATTSVAGLRTRQRRGSTEESTTTARRHARAAGSTLAVRAAARRAAGVRHDDSHASTGLNMHPSTPGPQRRPRRAAATAAAANFAAVANGGGGDVASHDVRSASTAGPSTSAAPGRSRGASTGKSTERPSRRTVVQWNREVAIDPRTGKAVEGPMTPGSFCSQCGALSTPVWRAGPFGHKTLCNACGVRWMKVTKKEYARHLC